MSRARYIAVLVITSLVVGAGALAFAFSRVPSERTPAPEPSPSAPDGLSVERVRVGNRDLWCVRNYNGGVWCDGTRDAS